MTNLPRLPPYRSQLLRMWVDAAGRPSRWRFSLEDVATGQRRGFADLDELICHLLALMETSAASEPAARRFSQSEELP
ncbi:MAG: hypothetical protein DYG89_28020 [Caldilinea sp. CFX5]|nr:hypothetical protein [Caldilinea sp. CFX5]